MIPLHSMDFWRYVWYKIYTESPPYQRKLTIRILCIHLASFCFIYTELQFYAFLITIILDCVVLNAYWKTRKKAKMC